MTDTSITPNLMVSNLSDSLAFYCDLLGFSLRMAVTADRKVISDGSRSDDLIYAQIVRGNAELMLQFKESMVQDNPAAFPADTQTGGSVTLYIQGESVGTLAATLRGRADIIRDPEISWYGMRELTIRDPDGYIIVFGEPSGPPPA